MDDDWGYPYDLGNLHIGDITDKQIGDLFEYRKHMMMIKQWNQGFRLMFQTTSCNKYTIRMLKKPGWIRAHEFALYKIYKIQKTGWWNMIFGESSAHTGWVADKGSGGLVHHQA